MPLQVYIVTVKKALVHTEQYHSRYIVAKVSTFEAIIGREILKYDDKNMNNILVIIGLRNTEIILKPSLRQATFIFEDKEGPRI